MNTDAPPAPSRRSRVLFALLGVAVVGLIASWMWPTESAAPPPPASDQGRTAKGRGQTTTINPADLDVRLEALQAARPQTGEVERNPFRFQPKPAPPPSLEALKPAPAPVVPAPQDIGPPAAPPITLKFIGTVERQGLKVAAVSDCKGYTDYGREGDTLDGRFRLVKIGVESIVIEYVNGTGRTTIRQEGCPAR
jgi:hypothetical protein